MDQSAGDSSAEDSSRSLTTEDDGLWNTAIGTDVERAKALQPNGAMGSKQDPITNTPQLEQSPETPEARVSPAGDGMTASPNDERQLMLAPTPATSSAGLVLSGMPGSPSPQVQDVVVTASLPLSHSEAEDHSEVSGSTHKPGDLLPGTSRGLAPQVEDIMRSAPPPTPPSLTAVERPVVSPSTLKDIVRQLDEQAEGDPEEEQPEEDGITLDPAEIKATFRNPDGSEGVASLWVLGECHDNAETAARQVPLPVPAYIGSDGQVERRMSPMPKSDGSLLYIPMCEACYDVDNPGLAKTAKFYCYHCRSQDKKAPCMFCLKCYIDEHQADALKSDHIVLKFFKPEILSSTEWNMEEPEMNMLLIGQRKDCVFCHGSRLLNASLRCNVCRIAFCVQCKDDHTDTDHKIIPTSHAAGKKGLDKFEKPLDVGKSFRARNDTVCGNDLDMYRKLDVVPLRMVMEYKPEKEFASGKRPAKILMHLSGAVSAVQRFQQGETKWGESVFGTRTMWKVKENGVFYDDPVQHPLFGETLAKAGAGAANIQLQKESTEVTSTPEDELMDIPQYFGPKEATVAAPPRNDLDHSNTDVDYGDETDADTDTRRSKSASTSRSSAPSVERSSRGMDRSSRGKDRSSRGKDDRRSSDLFFMRYSQQDEVSPIKPGDSVLHVKGLEYSTSGSEFEPASCSNSSSRVSAKANLQARGRDDPSRGRGTGRRERGRGGSRGREPSRGRGGSRGREPSRGRGGSRGGEPSRGRGGSRGRERSRGRDGSRGDESSRQPSSRGRQPPGRSDSNGREFIEPLVPNTRAKKNTPPANQPTIQQAMLGRRQPRPRAVASNAKNRKKNEREGTSVEDIEDMNDESESSDSTKSESTDEFHPQFLKKRKHRESSTSSGDSSSSHRSRSPARKKAQRKKAQTQKPPAKAAKVAPTVAKVAASDSRASYHAATSSAPPGRALINSRGDPGAKENAQKLPTKAAEVAPIVAQVAASSDSPAIDQRPANSLGNPRAIAIQKKAEAQKGAAKAAEVATNAAKAAAPSLTSAHAPKSKANVEGEKTIVINKHMLKRIRAHHAMVNSGVASNAQPSLPTKASLKSYPPSATVQPDASKAGKETVTEAGKDQVEAESEHTPPALSKQATLPYFTSDEAAVSPKQPGSKEAQVLVDGTISGSTSEPPTSELQKAINKVRASTKNYDQLTCHQAKSSAEAAIRLCSSFENDWKRGDSEPALTKYAKAWFVFDPDLNRPKNLIGAGVLRLIAQIGCDIYTCIICREKFGTSGTQPPFKQCIGRRVLPNGTKMRCCAVSHRDCLKPLEENAFLVCMEEKCASKHFGQMQNQFLWHLGRKRHGIANNFKDYHTGEDMLRALDRLAENHMITIMAKYDVLCPVVPSYLVHGTADGPT